MNYSNHFFSISNTTSKKNNTYYKRSVIVILILLYGLIAFTQEPTVGLSYNDTDVYDGYILFSPEQNTSVYLINNCGEVINSWTFDEKPGATCYLLENGNLLRANKSSLEIKTWDNEVVWSYAMDENGLFQHHDIEPLPNGNILCVINDPYSDTEIIEEGRDPSTVTTSFKLDKIVELQPVGVDEANIVWEWKFIDHLIQDFDNTKANYGVVEDHPELLDINFESGFNLDYTHLNAVEYSAVLDQILISPRNISEIIIIDHSTTTEEAASHTGGNSNMGGDFLWRWGNPQVYRQGTPVDQKLFLQHDPKWVKPGYLDEGKISVFNNGGDGTETISSVMLITPVIENDIYMKENNQFLPFNCEWSWSGSFNDEIFYERIKSGCHSLPNGNFIICEHSKGQVSEITKNGDHLWSYKNPTGHIIYNQYDTIFNQLNSLFRAEKYPGNYIGFNGHDLEPQGIIEDQNPYSEACITDSGIDIRLYVFLEGAFNGVDMDTPLNSNNFIPLDQPFNTSPWNYSGTEKVDDIPEDVVDWVLIELRDAANPEDATSATSISRQAAFLLNTGRVVGLNGSSILNTNVTFSQNLYMILWQRNHLGIMTNFSVEEASGLFTYDFSFEGQSYDMGQKDLGDGVYGMFAGDINADNTIDQTDRIIWMSNAGKQGYLMEDINLDGQSDNKDKNEFLIINHGFDSQVPE